MRGSKSILIFLFCFVAAFSVAQPINTVSNMAAAVKANAALPASGNGAGLTNVNSKTVGGITTNELVRTNLSQDIWGTKAFMDTVKFQSANSFDPDALWNFQSGDGGMFIGTSGDIAFDANSIVVNPDADLILLGAGILYVRDWLIFSINTPIGVGGDAFFTNSITARTVSVVNWTFLSQANGDLIQSNAVAGAAVYTYSSNGSLTVDGRDSQRLFVRYSDGNTASVGFSGGANLPGTFWSDVNARIRSGVVYGSPDTGGVTNYDAISTGGGVLYGSHSAMGTFSASGLGTFTNGVSSLVTNATLTMAAGGITNTTAIQYTIYGFTGTGVVLTNLSRPINITLGTITAPATIVLQPNDALMGTLCAAAGDRGF